MNKPHFISSKFFQEHSQKTPIVLVDAGARGGIPQEWQPFEKSLQAYCFEPDTTECTRLQQSTPENIHFLPHGLASTTDPQTLYVNKNPATSSLYPANPQYIKHFPSGQDLENIKTIQIDCYAYDDIAAQKQLPNPDFIKLDTQGSELDILKGAEKSLANCFGIFIEVEFFPIYKDQPLFSDVDNFLRKHNFTLFNLKQSPIKRTQQTNTQSKHQLLWGHALYLKDYILNPELATNLDPNKAINFIAIAELYGFTDFALELANLLNKDHHQVVSSLLLRNTPPSKFQKLFDKIKNLHYLFQ